MTPKVFVSHASEDKDRFVTEFATKLRSNGVDAWLDKWEMLPGDSLVDKIFEEGLKEADAIIIVLSENSVNKPWVREELNAGIVQRIGKGTKIIPVVLDKCEVPASLSSTIWQPIEDLTSYETSFSRIVSSIFGINEKPELGPPPAHTSSSFQAIGGLAKSDNLILKMSCDYIVSTGKIDEQINPEIVFGDGSSIGLSRREIEESLEVLAHRHYIKAIWLQRIHNDKFHCYYTINTNGFYQYALAYIDNHADLIKKTILTIINKEARTNDDIVNELNAQQAVIDNILFHFKELGYIHFQRLASGTIFIRRVSATLKRQLQ
jgi:hypothetical protein